MDHVFYFRCPYHRLRFVLSICLAFAREQDVYQVALTYPYSYSRVEERLNFYEILTAKCNEGREYFGLSPSSSSSSGSVVRGSAVAGSRTRKPAPGRSRNPSGKKTLFPIFDSPSTCIVFTRETYGQTLVSVSSSLPPLASSLSRESACKRGYTDVTVKGASSALRASAASEARVAG